MADKDKRVPRIGPTEDRCLICGDIIPEGIEICPMCWSMYFGS